MLKLLFVTMLLGNSAFAAGGSGFMLRTPFTYMNFESQDGAATPTLTKTNYTDVLLGLGYRGDSGFYIGGSYVMLQKTTTTTTGSTTVEVKDSQTGYGPSLGWVGQNLYLVGTYILAPVQTSTSGSNTTILSGGTGYVVELGYMFWPASWFGIGPQLTYYNATFKKTKTSGSESDLPSTASNTDLRPFVAIAFLF